MDAADIGGDDGQAAGHGFDHDIGQAFVEAAHAQHIGLAHLFGDLRRELRTQELHAVGDAQRVGEFLQLRAQRSFAGDHEARGAAELGEGAQQQIRVLHRQQVAHKQHGLAGLRGRFGGLEQAHIRTVVNGMQLASFGTCLGQQRGERTAAGDHTVTVFDGL